MGLGVHAWNSCREVCTGRKNFPQSYSIVADGKLNPVLKCLSEGKGE
jgi:hypothetical protein